MSRILVLLGIILCALSSTQAQQKAAASKIDSLAKLFDSTQGNAAKINVLANAPQRLNEYYEKPDAILQLYHRAVKIAESIGDKRNLILFLVEIAYFEMFVQLDEPKAYQLYSQALIYAEEEKDYPLCAQICYYLSAINEHQHIKSDMYEHLLKAIAYTQKSPVLFLRPYRWAYALYLEDNKIDDALKIGQQAVSYVNERAAPAEFKALAYGYYYAVLKQIPTRKQEADSYKQKIIDLLGTINIVSSTTISDGIANICNEVGQYKLAIFFASQLFEKTDRDSQLDATKISNYETISASYEQLGDYQKSLEYHKKYTNTYIKALKDIMSLESGRKIIRSEGERNLLVKQNEVEKERFYKNLSFAIAAFILILGGIVFLFYRREQKTKQELTQLNATKDKLFAILSHDLRSPVGALENNVMLTNWGALTQDEFVETTQNLGQEIRQVRTMLDNVLHWSISQLGGMKPNPKRLSLNEAIQEQLTLLQPAADAKNLTLRLQIKESVFVNADKNHVAIIFRNLLQNAIKFTRSEGSITLLHHEDSAFHHIQVKDTGIGMSQQQLLQLFQLGEQNSRQGTAAEKGTGLGLVLVKELVEANGGSIDVTSHPDVGTNFSLRFPK